MQEDSNMTGRLATLLLFLASVASHLLIVGTAHAVTSDIFSCDRTASGNNANCSSTTCRLITNITCDPSDPNQQGITLNSGANLDMNGFSISCKSGSTCSYPAVWSSSSSGGKIKNTASTQSSITGSFSGAAIDCAFGFPTGNGAGQVIGIKINVTAAYGIRRCLAASSNVVIFGNATSVPSAVGILVVVGGTAATHDNYVDGWPAAGIQNGGNAAKSFDHNLVIVRDYSGVTSYGLDYEGSSFAESATDNILFGNPTSGALIHVVNTPTITFAGNYCDPSTTACSTCIGAGECETTTSTTPVAPFTLPSP